MDGQRRQGDAAAYFCAPNFAFLMVADVRDAVSALPGVRRVDVRIEDHLASEEINAGMAGGLGDGKLARLRLEFLRKAHLAAQERVCRGCLRHADDVSDLTRLRLGDLPPSAELSALRRRRRDLGLPSGPDAGLLLHDDGRPVAREDLTWLLLAARLTRVSIEGNAAFCRGLLDTRYGARRPPRADR